MPRFPVRTLVLMLLALLAFGWMWFQTHLHAPPRAELNFATPPSRVVGGDQ